LATFAFIIHPINPREDVKKRFKLLGTYLPIKLIHFFSGYFPPLVLSKVKGIRSQATGEEIEGWLLACPLTARRMLEVPVEFAYKKIIATGRLAEKLGADIIGLGAFTSVVGDAGVTVARSLNVPVTTGNTYTVAASLQVVREVVQQRGLNLADITVAVVGATGSIGWAISRLLSSEVAKLILIARHVNKLGSKGKQLSPHAQVKVTKRMDAVREADVVILAAGAVMPLVKSRHLKENAIVCDIAIPSNVAPEVQKERSDVLLIKGGVVEVPGEPDFGFDFGLPPRLAYGCMAETIALAMEKRFEPYTLGRDISIEKVREIDQIASKHGFKPVAYPLELVTTG